MEEIVIHSSSRPEIQLLRHVARGFHVLCKDSEVGGDFEVFMRDGAPIGVRRNGTPIDLSKLTASKFQFYVQEPFAAYFKERRNSFRLNRGEPA